MAATIPVTLTGTSSVSDWPERYTLEITVDERGRSTFTLARSGDRDEARPVITDPDEAVWLIGQVEEGIRRLTAHLYRSEGV